MLTSIVQFIQACQFFWNPYSIPFLLSALFVLFIGSYVMIYGANLKQRLSFLGFSVSFFFWLFGTFFGYTTRGIEVTQVSLYLTYLGVTLISPSLYYYASVWLHREKQNKIKIIAAFLLVLPIMLVISKTDWIVYGTQKYFWGYHSRLTVVGGLFYLGYFVSVAVLFFTTLYQGFRTERDPAKKKQIRLVGIAFLIAYLGSSDFMPCYGIEVFPIGGLTMVGACGALAYTIIRYKLLDIKTVVHKTLLWMLTSFVLGVPLVLFFYFYKDWVHTLPAPAYLGILIISFLTVVAYCRTVQPRIDDLFQRRQVNLNLVLEAFSDELVQLIDLNGVVRHILTTMKRVFYVQHSSLLIREKGNHFGVMSLNKSAGGETYEMNKSLLKWFEANDSVLLGEYLQFDPRLKVVAKEAQVYFKKMDAKVCVPMLANGKLIALLNIGEKGNLKSFRPAEITFFSDLRRSSGIAISNTLQLNAIQENLKKWNVELEQKVEERTAQLKDTQAQLVQAEKMATIGILAGGVAHEINNPLMAVLSNVNFLKQTTASEDMKPISLIEAGAKRCQVIVNSLLKYSRKPEAEISFVDTDLNAVVKSACSFLDYQMKQENVEVRLELSEIPTIRGISNELEQVITNLVVNAKDAAVKNERPAQIILKTTEEDQSVVLTVQDNGEGMSKKIMGKIFDPFFTTKDVGGGTGLGLAVTYTIIQKHHGEIKVFSEEGVGTTFTVRIPRVSIR